MPKLHAKQHHVASSLGEPLTLASLPPPDTSRWVARRKAQVVDAVQIGLLTLDEALARYKLSLEEFTGWQRALNRHGLRGLQITHLQGCKLVDRNRQAIQRRREKRELSWSRQHA